MEFVRPCLEALRGAFFFSTSVELNTEDAGGGGAGHEIIDSNTSLPSILTPKHFFAVSAICFDRSDLACTCFSGRFLVQSCGRATCITTFVTRETICLAVKLNVLLGVVVKLVLGWRHMKLVFRLLGCKVC